MPVTARSTGSSRSIPKNVAVAQLDLTPRPPGHVAPVPSARRDVSSPSGGGMLFAMTDMPAQPRLHSADLELE